MCARGATVAVDLMSGDAGAQAALPACLALLQARPLSRVVLVGTTDALRATEAWPAEVQTRVRCVTATEVVTMDDSIEVALRRKKNASLRVAIEQLKADPASGTMADVCVSAGNTGALMAVARYVLKTMPGIDRPAIATVMPNDRNGDTTVLDLGANVDCTPEHLLQFALMGSALVTAVDDIPAPSVGLLNIGEEMIKGSDTIKRAGELLREAGERGWIHFIGNVEGNDIFKGTARVVVCDGFVGNVALKASEGLARMISAMLREEFSRSPLTKLAALAAMPVLNRFRQRVDPRRYNGAALLGLRGLVFKSHGSADAFAFENALLRAHDAASHQLLDRIQACIHDSLAPAAPIPAGPDSVMPAA
ncbi:phosphate acyltransferase PlsX [Amphibiibacter pelophylacis]|uniref:Phosphate acyltransferase PlsX n=1 Tax=Amphibiibacter pelophylacis TaxID=1799477 RepID=A0ACC6NY84_9BURK